MLSTRFISNLFEASGTVSFFGAFDFYNTMEPFLSFNIVFLTGLILDGISATKGAPRDDLEVRGSITGTNFGFVSFLRGYSITSLTTAFDFLKLSLLTTGLNTFTGTVS